MHGREDGENRKRIRHMWSVASRGSTTTLGVDSGSSSVNSFLKDGRRISVGDCALFKPPNDSPPFIGIIRSLSSDKDNSLKLRVNWLYRPAEVVVGKGFVLEAAPNEVFYSFHRDETPAASLLHPCKVAFLPKGAELPSGASSFVCRRVYDISNKCLWWLTDRDYIHDRQEEVDQLLEKSRLEMHVTVQQHQGTNSPKPVDGAAATSPLKLSPDHMQNSSSSASQPKGKKRDLGDQTSEPVKRERLMKDAGGDSVLSRSDSILKSEITKLSEKGGLVDFDSVEKLVQLMQPEKSPKKVDLSCRTMLVGIIASTDRSDCLNHFVHLRGVPVLDDWLQEVHKGKFGDCSSPKDGDKSVEDFLSVLLRALDKLPVNLNALKMCNIGKSVNHLRSHKNLEIQKKARSLVDTWKKRVEAEMNINDGRSAPNQPVPWHTRSRHDVPHGGNKHSAGSSETAVRSSGQIALAKSGSLKPAHGDATARAASVHSGSQKASPPLSVSTTSPREGQIRISSASGGSELLQTAVKEEKSSGSSQSHTNSQCSSDQARSIVPTGKEDARSSTAGSRSKTAGSSRRRKSANGSQGISHSTQRELGSRRNSSHLSSLLPEKPLESTTCDNNGTSVAESNSHRMIVKIPNRGCSPGQIANAGSAEDPSCRNSGASSPAHSEKLEQTDLVEKSNAHQNNEADAVPAPPDGKQYSFRNDNTSLADVPKAGNPSTGKDSLAKRSMDSSMSSINALIESCVKYSEAHESLSAGDDSGMNLLASVATGEISRSSAASPVVSPLRNPIVTDTANEDAARRSDGAPSRPSSVSNENPQQNGDRFLKTNGKLEEFAGITSAPVSSLCVGVKCDEAGAQKVLLKATIAKDESHDPITSAKQSSGSFLPAQGQVKDEKRSEDGLCRDQEDLPKHPSSNFSGENTNPYQARNSDAVVKHEPNSLATLPGGEIKDEGQGHSLTAHQEPTLNDSTKQKAENSHDVKDSHNFSKQEENASSSPQKEGSTVASAGCEEKADCKSDIIESKEREVERHLSSMKPEKVVFQGEKNVECTPSAVANAPSTVAAVSDNGRNFEFDLNEGFNMDDLKNGEPIGLGAAKFPASISLFSTSQSALSPASCGLPASVTVTSAAKRPFVPPEDLMRNKAELGWKGSAATSAFRPAEPRKVLETPTDSSKNYVKEPACSKPARPFLDIDLNVMDERAMQDMGCQNSAQTIDHRPDFKCGGFDLDLNKSDDAPEGYHHPTGNFQRLDVSIPAHQSSNGIAPNGIANGEAGTKRNFDLNDGPAADEPTVESLPYSQHARGNIPPQPPYGFRMNNATIGSLSSWYSPGTTYSAVMTPTALPDTPIIGAPGPHRVFGGPTTASSYNTDFYRGSVLSSSPAMPFATAPFQYSVFPFGTSFPLPTSSMPGGSAPYIDPSSGGRYSSPTVPTKLVGTAGAVSSQYLRPCLVSVPDVSGNGVVESSRKWGKQGLDLNSGPVGVDVEGRDEAMLMASRQLPAVNPQALVDEQARAYQLAGGVLKRKEPEGGWDNSDRLSYKHSSWQ